MEEYPQDSPPYICQLGVGTLFPTICSEFEFNIPETPNFPPDLPGITPECFHPFQYFCHQFLTVWPSVPPFQDTKDEPPMVQAVEVAATKFIVLELEPYWGSVQICPYLDSLSAIYLWQSDLDKAYSNGMFHIRALVPNGTLVFCAFVLEEDARDISDPKLACSGLGSITPRKGTLSGMLLTWPSACSRKGGTWLH